YNIQNNDNIHILNYYTVEQVLQFMDIKTPGTIMVNNAPAGPKEKIYDNFTIYCDMEEDYMGSLLTLEKDEIYTEEFGTELADPVKSTSPVSKSEVEEKGIKGIDRSITVIVNNTPVILQNKPSYIFVDIFDFYPFDLSTLKGSEVVITLNGQKAEFTTSLQENDVIELYWKK
ncbi:MAG: cell division protein FtsA, partial [Anaerocolumna sp.]|nr:cell division protein FtsA [Anaerocolumna sp.]